MNFWHALQPWIRPMPFWPLLICLTVLYSAISTRYITTWSWKETDATWLCCHMSLVETRRYSARSCCSKPLSPANQRWYLTCWMSNLSWHHNSTCLLSALSSQFMAMTTVTTMMTMTTSTVGIIITIHSNDHSDDDDIYCLHYHHNSRQWRQWRQWWNDDIYCLYYHHCTDDSDDDNNDDNNDGDNDIRYKFSRIIPTNLLC